MILVKFVLPDLVVAAIDVVFGRAVGPRTSNPREHALQDDVAEDSRPAAADPLHTGRGVEFVCGHSPNDSAKCAN